MGTCSTISTTMNRGSVEPYSVYEYGVRVTAMERIDLQHGYRFWYILLHPTFLKIFEVKSYITTYIVHIYFVIILYNFSPQISAIL